jgi:hypothetical protein
MECLAMGEKEKLSKETSIIGLAARRAFCCVRWSLLIRQAARKVTAIGTCPQSGYTTVGENPHGYGEWTGFPAGVWVLGGCSSNYGLPWLFGSEPVDLPISFIPVSGSSLPIQFVYPP